jgi:hypothetical protein
MVEPLRKPAYRRDLGRPEGASHHLRSVEEELFQPATCPSAREHDQIAGEVHRALGTGPFRERIRYGVQDGLFPAEKLPCDRALVHRDTVVYIVGTPTRSCGVPDDRRLTSRASRQSSEYTCRTSLSACS